MENHISRRGGWYYDQHKDGLFYRNDGWDWENLRTINGQCCMGIRLIRNCHGQTESCDSPLRKPLRWVDLSARFSIHVDVQEVLLLL